MERCFNVVANQMSARWNNAFVSVSACNIGLSCARRVPDVRPSAARVGAAWYRGRKRGTTWHRVARAANRNEHDVALRATRCCRLWEPARGAPSDVCLVWFISYEVYCKLVSASCEKNVRVR